MKKILLLSAYHAQSHDYWVKQLVEHLPEFDWTVLSLPPRYFSWRIRGNPISFAARFSKELAQQYDLILATSMTDLAMVKALNRSLNQIPSVLYFHENQFVYPEQAGQSAALEAKMVSLYSAMVADKLVFNSRYNQETFLQGVESLLHKMPDLVAGDIVSSLKNKASVIGVPVSVEAITVAPVRKAKKLKLCWAARWEYDKGPELLLKILQGLEKENIDFEISILGQSFRNVPEAFEQIQQEFKHRINQWGYLENKTDYWRALAGSHIFISTAHHEFFGISAAEAQLLGCHLILPDRLVYPELYPDAMLYSTVEQAVGYITAFDVKSILDEVELPSNLIQSYKDLLMGIMAG